MKARFSFDIDNDFAILKINDIDYSHSLEKGNVLIDLSSKDEISGVRVFDATKFFGMSKKTLAIMKDANILGKKGNIKIVLKGKDYQIKEKKVVKKN